MWRKILTIVRGNKRVTEHAMQIDTIFGIDVPNRSHKGNPEEAEEA